MHLLLLLPSLGQPEGAPGCIVGTEELPGLALADEHAGRGIPPAAGTADKIAEIREKLISGEIHVFDTSAFTVDGKNLDSYKADVDTDAEYTPDTEVIADGYFHESEYRSAPYFDLRIDGITLLDEKF